MYGIVAKRIVTPLEGTNEMGEPMRWGGGGTNESERGGGGGGGGREGEPMNRRGVGANWRTREMGDHWDWPKMGGLMKRGTNEKGDQWVQIMLWGTYELGEQWEGDQWDGEQWYGGPMRWGTNQWGGDQWDGGPMRGGPVSRSPLAV